LDAFATEAIKSVAGELGKIIIAVLVVNHAKDVMELLGEFEKVVGGR
jgi:hypothetical protein